MIKAMRTWAEINLNTYVVPLYQAWQQDGFLCLQMHLCEGGSLLSYIEHLEKEYLWKEKHLWRCIGDVMTALAHIHTHGFLHNDVKPGNMYVSKSLTLGQDGNSLSHVRVMLGDFDRVTKASDAEAGDEGDARYMAYEVLSENISFASDIFSLGISFYEVAARVHLPENGQMWHDLRNNNIPKYSSISENLYAILSKMMAQDPNARPAITSLLQDEAVKKSRDVKLSAKFQNSWCNEKTVSPFPALTSGDTEKSPPISVSSSGNRKRRSSAASVATNNSYSSYGSSSSSPRRCLFGDFDCLNKDKKSISTPSSVESLEENGLEKRKAVIKKLTFD
uniref:Protein kinase domain-containing protein n=1 Tax=Aplanochytrium stocchinoi TaxID=215587 RepID=A0A7S3PL74_9STRA